MPDLKAFLAGGETGAYIRARDWSSTPLGPIQQWPQSLRSALGIALRSAGASAVYWGPDHRFLYNDAWAALLGERHPWAMGRPAAETLEENWPQLRGQFERVMREGEPVNMFDAKLVRTCRGAARDSYWTYSLLPVAGEDGTIGGILAQVRESTNYLLRARRDALMMRLADRIRLLPTPKEVLDAALELLAEEVDVARLCYAEFDDAAGTLDILACRCREGMDDISGRYPIRDAGDGVQEDLRAGRAVRIDDVAASPRMADPEVRACYAASGSAALLCVPILSSQGGRAILFAHHDSPKGWDDHEETLLAAAIEHISREISRARAEAALRGSEERYRRIFEQANDLILTADLELRITDCNPAAAAALGIERAEIIGRSVDEFLTSEGRRQAAEMLAHKLRRGGTTRHEIEVVVPGGGLLHWEVNSTLTRDPAGKPLGLHAIARDITERRRAEARQRLLVNELNHRVKNMLALVQGLALQTFKDGRDMAEARAAFQQRLTALAAAHDLLTRESWEGATLDELVHEALGHHNEGEPRLSWSGPPVRLNPKAAVSLVMALHELSTNAAKYGALSRPEGRVTVDWRVDGERLAIEWRERGGPRVETPTRRGFGFRMIERALAADLSGGARLDFDPEGLTCRIDAALADAAPRPAEA